MTNLSKLKLQLSILLAICCTAAIAQKPPKPIPPIEHKQGKFSYTKDSLGNRVPDFSYCGYKASEQTIPNVDIKIVEIGRAHV